MSLTGRFSMLFLSVLGLVLIGFSLTLYVSARVYLSRQLSERLAASLAVLAAAAEVHPAGVEWEPQERVLPLGQDFGPERLRWMVFDSRGNRVDRSRNLVDADLTPGWVPAPGRADLPARLVDHHGRAWRLSQRAISPATESLSTAAADPVQTAASPVDEVLYPSLVLTVCAPLEPVEATLAALAWYLVALSMAIWLVCAFLCRRLSRRVLAPLTRLVESARDLDATDPGWCLEEVGTGDELDRLGGAFNALLARLQVAYERQRRFSGDASHQLRTPLTVLIGQIEVALRQERSTEEYQRVLNAALRRATQLARITESLLFLARADMYASLPDCECLEMNHWIAAHLASRVANDPGPRVLLKPAMSERVCVRAHSALLGQMLDNLLDNARKYGSPNGCVRVEIDQTDGEIVLAVEDDGPGIAETDRSDVFEPFFRSAQARRLGVPGVGLGLAVVRRIATAFGGSVSLQSTSAHGSRFEVRLPAVEQPGPATTTDDELARDCVDSRLVVELRPN